MGNELQPQQPNDINTRIADLTDHWPGILDGYDPTPRSIPFHAERPVATPGRARVPLGHIVNMGDFEKPASS